MLGYQLYLKENKYSHYMQWTTNNIEELKEKMDEQRIQLHSDIPKEIPEMHFLQIKNKVYAINETLEKNISETPNKNLIESFAQQLFSHYQQYQYDLIQSDNKQYYVYYQMIDGYPIYGAKIEIIINENQSITYSQNYCETINQGLDRQVIPAYSALRTVLEQQIIPENAEILQILLGYHGDTNQTNIQVFLTPVWRITYQVDNIKEELYVNAMTGSLENMINY